MSRLKTASLLPVALITAGVLTGCQAHRSHAPDPLFPRGYTARVWEGPQEHEVVANLRANSLNEEVLCEYFAMDPGPERRAMRDRIITTLMFLIDQGYEQFTYDLYTSRAHTNVFMDMSVLGLTGAATVTGGESAKTLLAAIATLVEGSRLSIDKNLFFEQASPVLIATMTAVRESTALRINSRLSENNTLDYTLTMALSDVLAYYQAGTVPAAIAQLGVDASVRTNEVKIAELIKLRNRLYDNKHVASGEAINNLLPADRRVSYADYAKAAAEGALLMHEAERLNLESELMRGNMLQERERNMLRERGLLEMLDDDTPLEEERPLLPPELDEVRPPEAR